MPREQCPVTMDTAVEGKELIDFLKSCKSKRPNSEDPWTEKRGLMRKKRKLFAVQKDINIKADDLKTLKNVCKKAHYLDHRFHCCCFGVSLGWSAIIGLVPVIGDAMEIILSLSLVREASKIDGGLPRHEKTWMYLYIMLDFLVGFFPVLGDLFDIGFRANTRIAWLLNDYLVGKAIENIQKETGQLDANGSRHHDLEKGIVRHVESTKNQKMVSPARISPPERSLTRPHDPRYQHRTQGRRH